MDIATDGRSALLSIDLNEAPPPPYDAAPVDAFSVVCSIHGTLTQASGLPAEYPGEAGAGRAPLPCGLCGFPETRGTTVVCDGCERGFHLGCAEIRDPRGPRDLEDWICVECSMIGGPKKRWTLGAARLLDINALPPSDGDVDAFPSDELRSNNPDGAHLYEFAGQHAFPNKGNLQSDLLLQSLRDFIMERGGFLGEDWHVEFKQPSNKSDWVPVYCAPDGKKFEAVYDVAHYLGIMSSSFSSSGIERNVGPGMVHKLLPPRRRKKELARVLTRNSSFENQNIMRSKVHGELLYDTEALVLPCCDAGNVSIISKYSREENVSDGSQNLIVELPVQYEDFFITSVGKVDLRMSYHDNRQIWPVGYRAIWHDRISGSFFHCEVSDGGDLGPVFKVRRCPCSVLPIPNGATIITRNKIAEVEIAEEKESYGKTCDAGYDKEDDILLLLLDPSPSELDFLVTKDDCFVQISSLRDEIGEFYVEGRSSSSVWRMVTQTLIDTCREVYKKSGRLQFCCRHNNKIFPKYTGKTVEGLERFCSASGPIDTPQIILSDKCLETTCKSLTKWIDQDRFGLDMSFVQEIIETIPGSRACSRYQFLNDRSDLSTTWTVGSGLLLAINKTEQGDEKLADFAEGTPLTDCRTPHGRPLSSRLPEELAGDVLQVCEFLWRFREILGLKEPFSFEELEEELLDPWPCSSNHTEKYESYPEIHGENHFTFIPIDTAPVREAVQAKLAAHTYDRCNGVTLTKAHISLLKILIGELICKVVIFVDPSFDARESKSRRGRKKDVDNTLIKEIKIDTPAVNELTWPELARRYVLAVSSMSACTDSQEVCSREGVKVFRCLQGDGGVLCGSLCGVAGMEADALLVAEAERQIFDPRENEILSMDVADSDAARACEPVVVNVILPEWAEALEPVRKLPTNVGTRIRKCIYDSLEKDPPEWARKVLEHSISKEVYKGNASGPTKKAVLSVLAEVSGSNLQQKPDKGQKEKIAISVSDVIMRKCRFVLRCSVSADENKVFCNLLGTTLMNSIDGEDEGTIGFPAMVSRPLDFRTIDLRLAVGAYLGSHEVFLEDVHEVWHNILMAYGDRPDLIKLVETLVRNFESLYEKEVLSLVQKFVNYTDTEKLDAEAQKELHDILLNENEIPKAPWDEGVCKVCGIDKDDDSVLLCDTCDSEFHTYCLNPPLARIPEGNWYCPSCLASESKTEDACHHSPVVKRQPTRRLGEDIRAVDQLLTAMEEREYWDFSIEERIFLLKFLCDEALSSALLREHLEQCADKSNDLQQKLRSLSVEWRNLKAKEELLEMRKVMENTGNSSGIVDALREGAITSPGRLTGQQINDKSNRGTFFSGGSLKRSYIPTEYSLENKKEELSGQDEQPLLVSSQGNDKEGEVVHGVGQENVEMIVMGLENINHDSLDTKSILSKDRNSPIVSNANIDPISYNWKDLMPMGSEINMLASEPLDQDLAFQGKHYNVHAGVTGYEPSDLETNSLKNEISHLQGTIASLESQLTLLSLRRDLLGRDSSNRLYWVIGRPGKRPWLVVDGSISAPWERKKAEDSRVSVPRRNYCPSGPGSVNQSGSHLNQNLSSYSPMVLFESDDEIRDLVDWLGDTDPREKKLKKSILQWQKFGSHQGIGLVADDPQLISTSISTKSAAVLETKYGPFLEIETNEAPKKRGRKGKLICEERMHRCECLEPVWPSRYHCLSCHQTFCTITELEGHNDGRCMVHALDESRESDESLKGKGARPENIREKEQVGEVDTFETLRNGKSTMSSKLVKVGKRKCPYDFDEICKKFVTKKSSKELVQEIGLIGANGVPSFVPSPIHSPDPSLIFNSVKTYDTDSCHSDSGNGSGCINKPHHNILANGTNEDIPKGHDQIQGLEVSQNYTIPESSLRPIVGKTCQILKRLKINLLDMEAALPEEALRPSKANLVKRCAWRAFVKSAESIFEMVQSTVVFEGMIKTEYLKNRWWHWSSLTAAAKTSTISSLALRIYTLDDCIMYAKESTKIVKKRKDMEVGSS